MVTRKLKTIRDCDLPPPHPSHNAVPRHAILMISDAWKAQGIEALLHNQGSQ